MRTRNRKGFTLPETLLAVAIAGVGLSLASGSFVLALHALSTGADALLLQREADQILNMEMAPEIRLIQTMAIAGEHHVVFQCQSPDTGMIETRGFVFQNNQLLYCESVPYSPSDLEATWDYMDQLSEQSDGVKVLGRFVEDVLFSFRDGGNNLVSMTEGTVDDPTGIEIVDVRLTLARNRQVYQITNSFIPIRQFI